MAAIGGMGGAASLGNATGKISIDVTDLQNIIALTKQVGDLAAKNLGVLDSSAKKAEGSLARLSNRIGSVKGELSAISVGAGLLTGAGLQAASAFEDANVLLEGMTGSVEKGAALMEQLRKKATEARQPFSAITQASVQLLPTLKGNTDQLGKWLDIARRVAVLRPAEGMTGAAFSLNEMLTSVQSGTMDLLSLAERFSISKGDFRAAMAQFNSGAPMEDALNAMDLVLNKMGITEETADKMGQTFSASLRLARDAATQLMAVGFGPLLDMLTPLLQQSAAYLATVSATNPAVLKLGAGLVTLAAVGAPALLLFNQLVEAGQKLAKLKLAGALGSGGIIAGGVALAGAAGIGANTLVNRGIGLATGNEAQANTTFSDSLAYFRNGVAVIVNALIDAGLYVSQALIKVAQALFSTVATVNQIVGGMLRYVGSVLPGGGLGLGKALTTAGDRLTQTSATNRAANAELDKVLERMWAGGATMKQGVRGFITGSGSGASGDDSVAAAKAQAEQEAAATKAQIDIKVKWAADTARIESSAATARLDATRQYEEQRTQAIAQYEQGIARDAEDFARSRARAAQQLAKQIADVAVEAGKREAKWQANFDESMADLRAETNKRVAKIEEDYAKDNEKAARDHRDRLLSAAARLDAIGVFEEQKRWATQQSDAEEALDERLTTEQENLDERLAEEKKNHAERLKEARLADAERIVAMQESLAEAQRLEDEDRAVAAERRAADFAAQQAQQATAQAERMAAITTQAAAEKKALDAQFMAELEAAGIHNKAWLALQKAKQDAALVLFDAWWGEVNKRLAVQGPAPQQIGTETQAGWPTDFTGGTSTPTPGEWISTFDEWIRKLEAVPKLAGGGWIDKTGIALVHAGEFVAPAGRAAAMAGGSSRNITIGDIYVTGSPGMDANALAAAMRREIVAVLEEAS